MTSSRSAFATFEQGPPVDEGDPSDPSKVPTDLPGVLVQITSSVDKTGHAQYLFDGDIVAQYTVVRGCTYYFRVRTPGFPVLIEDVAYGGNPYYPSRFEEQHQDMLACSVVERSGTDGPFFGHQPIDGLQSGTLRITVPNNLYGDIYVKCAINKYNYMMVPLQTRDIFGSAGPSAGNPAAGYFDYTGNVFTSDPTPIIEQLVDQCPAYEGVSLGANLQRYTAVWTHTLNVDDPGITFRGDDGYTTQLEVASGGAALVQTAPDGEQSLKYLVTSSQPNTSAEVVSALKLIGSLDASTEPYALQNTTANPGDYLLVTKSGTLSYYSGAQSGDNNAEEGDIYVWDGTTWQHLSYQTVQAQIYDGSITNAKLAAGAVETDNIQEQAVTADKLAPNLSLETMYVSDQRVHQLVLDDNGSGSSFDPTSTSNDAIYFGAPTQGSWRICAQTGGAIMLQTYDATNLSWATQASFTARM